MYISIISLQCCQHVALNANARQVLPELLTRNGIKGLPKVHKTGVEAIVRLAGLHCFAGLNECPHDENVIRCAVVASEASLACSSQTLVFSPAADSALQHSGVALGEDCASSDASLLAFFVKPRLVPGLCSWGLYLVIGVLCCCP